jgi:predicted anti-sigma-YlaC factor YlaD
MNDRMNETMHQRAQQLIAARHIEIISAGDRCWLDTHLAECPACAAHALRIGESLSALRTMHLDLPPNLAARTQFRIRLRSEELSEKEPAKKLVWAIAAISWAIGVATAPWVWHGVEWLGQETGAPRILLQAGFALWWTVPPMIAAWAALSEKRVAQSGSTE